MRMFSTTIIVFVLIVISGCKDQGVTPPPADEVGTVNLSFADAPPNITQVVARLSRRGYDD